VYKRQAISIAPRSSFTSHREDLTEGLRFAVPHFFGTIYAFFNQVRMGA